MKWKNYLRPALCGAAAGFVNTPFVIRSKFRRTIPGGGMVLVPLLIRLGKMEDKKAFSSSVCIILPLCLVSLGIYAAKGMLPLLDALPYLIGGAGGGVLAGLLFRKVPARALHLTLGALILLGGVRLLLC